MNLTSCKNCGVVLDKDKLKFPEYMEAQDGSIDLTKGVWDDVADDFKLFVPCPVCKEAVTK